MLNMYTLSKLIHNRIYFSWYKIQEVMLYKAQYTHLTFCYRTTYDPVIRVGVTIIRLIRPTSPLIGGYAFLCSNALLTNIPIIRAYDRSNSNIRLVIKWITLVITN